MDKRLKIFGVCAAFLVMFGISAGFSRMSLPPSAEALARESGAASPQEFEYVATYTQDGVEYTVSLPPWHPHIDDPAALAKEAVAEMAEQVGLSLPANYEKNIRVSKILQNSGAVR